jgi:peptide/nickel transport system permease protein
MLVTILKNIATAALSLLIISISIFLLSKIVPGDPVDDRLSIDFDQAAEVNYKMEYERIKKVLRLDLPPFYFAILPKGFPHNINGAFLTRDEIRKERKHFFSDSPWNLPTFHWYGSENQYHQWIFSPGNSIVDGRPVGSKIGRSLVWTLFLVLTSVVLSYAIGILIGLGLSSMKSKTLKNVIESILFGLYAIPVFWLATILLVFFTTKEYGAWTNIFPSVGLSPIDLGEAWYVRISNYGSQLVLPCVILVLHNLAFLSTLTKRNIEQTKEMDFVQTAKAYGFTDRYILFRDILPFSLIPLITSISSAIPAAIGGSLVIEIIFNIPGMGRLLYNAILNYDWPIVFPVVMLVAVFAILSFLLADIAYRLVDPRMK